MHCVACTQWILACENFNLEPHPIPLSFVPLVPHSDSFFWSVEILFLLHNLWTNKFSYGGKNKGIKDIAHLQYCYNKIWLMRTNKKRKKMFMSQLCLWKGEVTCLRAGVGINHHLYHNAHPVWQKLPSVKTVSALHCCLSHLGVYGSWLFDISIKIYFNHTAGVASIKFSVFPHFSACEGGRVGKKNKEVTSTVSN